MSLLHLSETRFKEACDEHAKHVAPIPKDQIRWATVAKTMQSVDLRDDLASFIRRDVLREEPEPTTTINSDVCAECGVQMIVIANDSMLACSRCGVTRVITTVQAWNASMDADFSSLNVHQKSRLLEWLEYAQGKDNSEVPRAVLDEMMSVMVRHKLTGLEEHASVISEEVRVNGPFLDASSAVTRLKSAIPNIESLLKNVDSIFVRNVFKNCSITDSKKFVERSAKVASLLSGYFPERLTADQEEYIRKLFMAAAPVYDRYRKASQPNWPGGYAYFLRCLLILLGWDEIAALFPIQLTSRNAEREEMRANIWAVLQWENVPSVGPLSQIKLSDGTIFNGSIIADADKKCKISARGYDEML